MGQLAEVIPFKHETAPGVSHDGISESLQVNGQFSQQMLRPLAEENLLLEEIYAKNAELSETAKFSVNVKGSSIRVLHLNELLIGDAASSPTFYNDVVERVKATKKSERPQIAVLSGFMAGTHEITGKPRRESLVMTSLDRQYKEAHDKIKMLTEAGVNVYYNLGSEDNDIARENTIKIFQLMEKYACDFHKAENDKTKAEAIRAAKEAGVKHNAGAQTAPNFMTVDAIKRDYPDYYQKHRQFQTDHIMPFCLRAGRSLYNAQEMAEITKGEIQQEEYFLLYDMQLRLDNGKKATKNQKDWVRQVQSSPD